MQASGNHKPRVYFLPGLGADHRMYFGQKQITELDIHFIDYLPPEKGEDFRHYVKRLSELIDQSQPFSLIGTSLGGIMVIEMTKIMNPEQVVILSSVKTRKELPLWMRFFSYVPIHRLLTGKILLLMFFILQKILPQRNSELKKRLRKMAEDANPYFVQWASDKVINWQNDSYPENLIHIHGTRDPLFPIWRIKDPVRVKGGTHIMVLNKVREVNHAIKRAFAGLLAKYISESPSARSSSPNPSLGSTD